MSVVVASLVRDEMTRFLPRALAAWDTFASHIAILDDNSTDGSYEFAKEFGAITRRRDPSAAKAWGAEGAARRELFEFAWDVARVDDHILVLDADMTPARDPRAFCTPEVDGVWFVLYDLWDVAPLRFRADRFWRGHHVPRLWSVRKTKERPKAWEWHADRIHVGHFPSNLPLMSNLAYAPPDHGLLHFAYAAPELREEKYVRYASVAADLTDFERAHAISILDDAPSLERLGFEPDLTLA